MAAPSTLKFQRDIEEKLSRVNDLQVIKASITGLARGMKAIAQEYTNSLTNVEKDFKAALLRIETLENKVKILTGEDVNS